MSNIRSNDPADRANVTDASSTFKKTFQTVGRPPVTERDIHEEYLKDSLKNEPYAPNTGWTTRDLKEGAREETGPKQDGVLGDQPVGKIEKESALEALTTQSSIHPGNPSSD
ncbi:hypothetical protein C8Q79DRAFT_952142 [Trametes meyenii]|nr:hypothetical protein C8Q79DRAFT_952142 [Trametes meyenii]